MSGVEFSQQSGVAGRARLILGRLAKRLWRPIAAYLARMGVFGWLVLIATFVFMVSETPDAVEWLTFRLATPGEHLQHAVAACPAPNQDNGAALCPFPAEAQHQLWAIPANAKEHGQATDLLSAIQARMAREEANKPKTVEDARRLAYEQMQKNVSGQANDEFICANGTVFKNVMSFDNGKNWWRDDGRCAEQLQKKRDADAQTSSYWPTTLRVDTDMDSSWLPDEERTCQTYPDDKGKVSVVGCNATGSHRDHNIPVKFWGGLERNTTSDWKCRREGDEFVCRAVD